MEGSVQIFMIKLLFAVILTTGQNNNFVISSSSQVGELIREQEFPTYTEMFQNIVDRNLLKNFYVDLGLEEIYKSNEARLLEERDSVVCTACELFFEPVIRDVQNGANFTVYIDMAIQICYLANIGSLEFCQDFLYLIEPDIEFVFTNKTGLTGNDWCGMMILGEGCVSENPERYWSFEVNGGKPTVEEPPYNYDAPTMKFLHLSDTHYDPYYVPGANTNCPMRYLCCRADSGEVMNPEDAAGFWGDYRDCDIPKWLLENMYQHIAQTHPDLDFIIWTGDIVPHNVWSTSKEDTTEILTETSDLLSQYFPGVPVYPALGNHEGHPVNAFPQSYIPDPFNITWLYGTVDNLWGRWLDPTTSADIQYGGYYSQVILSGLRLISVNTNYCYSVNWWMVIDSNDVSETLQFMADELQAAETAGERAYLIMHISPGHGDCHPTWAAQFNVISNRYEHTIAGIFYGHSHGDDFRIFFDNVERTRPYAVGYDAGSQTTYSNYNPGYRVYTAEGDYLGTNYNVLDHENWILDLEVANAFNVTNYYKLYTAKDEYELSDLSPQSWYDLVLRMDEPGNILFDHYYRNHVKNSRPKLEGGCSESCKRSNLCTCLTSDNSRHDTCDVLTSGLTEN